ncbi:unnamed protein product [Bursaphelenchus okinawaensis]|uniref:Uncharacterized protein n=1 Tax=Bursaphelenchus okinawaensis TaxID=465554 RepID=A0A811L8M5_9BILA|nr:unnamed protein product [Bursaphelenchus okinawaensis]CAG9118366.1 unnamed protein product [Bursaphelenchus okinawaensis]
MGLFPSKDDRRLYDENGFEIWSAEAMEVRDQIKRRQLRLLFLTLITVAGIGVGIAYRQRILNALRSRR